jgi:hypothetical protein
MDVADPLESGIQECSAKPTAYPILHGHHRLVDIGQQELSQPPRPRIIDNEIEIPGLNVRATNR